MVLGIALNIVDINVFYSTFFYFCHGGSVATQCQVTCVLFYSVAVFPAPLSMDCFNFTVHKMHC